MSSAPPSSSSSSSTYTLTLTFHRAHNLPVADIPSFSSDPYIRCFLTFPSIPNPSDDIPPLQFRSRTIRRSTEPEWESTWTVANVPADGARIKIRVIDEDTPDHDDVLGGVTIETGRLSLEYDDERKEGLMVRRGGRWIALSRILLVGCGHGKWRQMAGELYMHIKVDGKTEETGGLPHPFTIGPHWWSIHSSPLIGRITKTTDGGEHETNADGTVQKYTFRGHKLQLAGPLPPELKQQYVAFAPWVKQYFTKTGLKGRILNTLLKKQYRTIYSYDRGTEYGVVAADDPEDEADALARRLLEMCDWGEGGRLFTYVITLDAEWRFTETGPEFGIQYLSKHSTHSNVAKFIAFSGEFFVRQHHHQHHIPHHASKASNASETLSATDALPDARLRGDRDRSRSPSLSPSKRIKSRHPKNYELVIDNNSGTYRPPKEKLPKLQEFLKKNLGSLKVSTYDGFDEKLEEMRDKHLKEKEREGRMMFKQPSSSRSSSESSDSSISSSDEDEILRGRVGMGRSMKRRARKVLEGGEDPEEKMQRGRKGKGKSVTAEASGTNGASEKPNGEAVSGTGPVQLNGIEEEKIPNEKSPDAAQPPTANGATTTAPSG